ncbi:MAG: glycosyltransferase family 4 protein, partial [bacterium]|nr:glycosyltransferase family 4 protein [bacterium]
MNKKLLIINRDQFGYHIDTYNYCRHANLHYSITYICFDSGKPRIEASGIKCTYVSRKGNILFRYLRLMFAFLRECKKEYNVIFVKYFTTCVLLKIANPTRCFIFDIRTGSTETNVVKRKWKDAVLRFESWFFDRITVISPSLVEKLKLPDSKVHILPLGANPVDGPKKHFEEFNLLYVGTLNKRRIEDTINGVARFIAEYKNTIKVTYDIIGDGD